MYQEVSKLLLYSDLGKDSILAELCRVFEDYDKNKADKDTTVFNIYAQVKRILDLATSYGFNKNLWQNYLTFVIINNENSFSLTCERKGATQGGSVNISRAVEANRKPLVKVGKILVGFRIVGVNADFILGESDSRQGGSFSAKPR